MGRPEGAVERHFTQTAEKNGFACYKFTSPSRAGVPDRIIIGHGATIFVELKAPHETPRALQKAQFDIMRRNGAQVYVIDTKEKTVAFFEALRARTRADGLLDDDVRLNAPAWRESMDVYVERQIREEGETS